VSIRGRLAHVWVRSRTAIRRRDALPDTGSRPRRKIFPLSIRTSLVAVVFIPLAMSVGLASTVVLHQSSIRQTAETARQYSLVLDSLLNARIDIYAEYVPTAAIQAADEYHVSTSVLDSLLGINVKDDLVDARRAVNHLAIFRRSGMLAANFVQLTAVRRRIDDGSATRQQAEAFFNQLDLKIDARWNALDRVLNADHASDSSTTRDRLAALGSTFSAFTFGLGEESLSGTNSLETALTTTSSPAEIRSLIVNSDQFTASTRGFTSSLGPKGRVAWKALQVNPLNTQFTSYVELAIAVGLAHEPAPFTVESTAIRSIARSEVMWANSLSKLVLASSADLRVATVNQTNSATMTLIILVLFMLLLVCAAVGAVLIFGREVRRPLARIVAAATYVREGELELPHLDESGPRELSLAAGAFNEMSSTLRAVQAQAVALSGGDFENPALKRSLPGRTGAALQSALSTLQRSVRERETQRRDLFQRATRDSLTGLLNRGAALEALELDLARVHRSQGALELTILFIDLDELKKINDSLGHEGGDTAIRLVADALREATRASDVVARYGGDEFVVGWLGDRDSSDTTLLAARISNLVASSVVAGDGRSLALGCSIGVAVSEERDSSVEKLIERADHALYTSKAEGRGGVRWFAPS
jgi:diguanylate cyclase (GGDEF)-like protein